MQVEGSADFLQVLEILARVAIMAMLLERALALLFEQKVFRDRIDRSGLKEIIVLAVAWGVCATLKFDALSAIFDPSTISSSMGIFLTAAVVAGGSKGAVRLFQEVLKFGRDAQREQHDLQRKEVESARAELVDKKKRLEAETEALIAEATNRRKQAELAALDAEVTLRTRALETTIPSERSALPAAEA
jgi:hypothetical protein